MLVTIATTIIFPFLCMGSGTFYILCVKNSDDNDNPFDSFFAKNGSKRLSLFAKNDANIVKIVNSQTKKF